MLNGPTVNPYYLNETEETRFLLGTHHDFDDKDGKPSQTLVKSRELYLTYYRFENISLFFSYFCLGATIYLMGNPINYYLIHYCDASSTQIGVLATVQSLPWSFKIIFGLLSDSFPILKYHRKSYFLLGWAIFISTNIALSIIGKPSIITTIIGILIMTCAVLMANVCSDAMFVERSKLEEDVEKGTFQSLGFTVRALGNVFGAFVSTILYNKDDWGWGLTISQIFLLNGILPVLLVLPSSYPLVELCVPSRIAPNPSLRDQLRDIWTILQMKAAWSPLLFIYTYNALQIPNSAWYNFLVEGLSFSSFDLGLLSLSSACMTWLGLVIYRSCLFHLSWRGIFVFSTVLGVIFSVLQLLLILRVTEDWGLPDLPFALGDNTLVVLVSSLQLLPTCILFLSLCPPGGEGSSFALLTTISNLAMSVASGVGSCLTGIWDVSNTTLSSGDFSGLAKLSLLTSLIQILPIILVGYLPSNLKEQSSLIESGGSSRLAGSVLLSTIFLSLAFAIFVNVYLLV